MTPVVRRSEEGVAVEVTVQRNGSLLEMETAIQEATNAVGCCVATNTVGRWAQFWQKIDQFGAECYC